MMTKKELVAVITAFMIGASLAAFIFGVIGLGVEHVFTEEYAYEKLIVLAGRGGIFLVFGSYLLLTWMLGTLILRRSP